jgi:uncharacterized damage-inducible protein DinB
MMSTAEQLTQDYATTTWIINKQAEGLTHEQMMIQPPFRGNCFNWVLGHITANRDRALRALQAETILTEAERERYLRGSDPVTGEATAVRSEKLLAAVNEFQERIQAALEAVDLASIYNEEQNQSLADRIAGLHWHETYHTGQLELLRQLAGTNDAIIR